MRSPWTTLRMISATAAIMLIGFGVKCLFDGHRLSQNFELWQTAKPVAGPVDFSTSGRFTFPFDQTCSSSHGETVLLRVPAEALKTTTATQLLAGLNAKLEITNKSKSNIVESANSEIMWGQELLDGAIPIFGIAPFSKGQYEATVTVLEGAPALKGITQRIEGRYLLCGLELLPATIANAVGIGSSVIGSILGFAVLFLATRDQKRFSSTAKAA